MWKKHEAENGIENLNLLNKIGWGGQHIDGATER